MNDIFKGIEYRCVNECKSKVNFGNMEYDSRKIRQGDIFIALEGTNVDGHRFIDEAIKNGASMIIGSKEIKVKSDVGYYVVENLRKKSGIIASNFYDSPEKNLIIIGVTGTNGKTTTTYLIEQLLEKNSVARIGTIEYKIGDEVIEAPNTTPESIDIIKIARKAVDKGMKYLVMEVSSHGLSMGRVEMLDFDIAVFTNLTPEHLDYHKDMNKYYQAKKMLFEKLKDRKKGVINIDCPYGKKLYEEFGGISYSLKEEADLDARDIEKFNSPLLGKFNKYNLLASIGVAKLLGIELEIIREKIKRIKGAPGRFEFVDEGQEFKVIVDYAHTEDALANILEGVKELENIEKIITIFGCGGDRDRTKRPVMAKISEKLSDLTIITSDNPRTENPDMILKEISTGFTTDRYIIEVDRGKAISKAISKAKKNDVVVIAGKGHETYQIIGKNKIDFDDRVVASECIKILKGVG